MTDHSPGNAGAPTRRAVVEGCAVVGALGLGGFGLPTSSARADTPAPGDPAPQTMPVRLTINGQAHDLNLDTRTSLLDTRQRKMLTQRVEQGGAGVEVLVNGRRINSCLTLAVMHEGDDITTIEGLAQGETLHPMQAAFIQHDGFQCGYCTPGQICSAVGMLNEVKDGFPSHVTDDLTAKASLNDAEIRERMAGNICRCSAYPNIVAAIRDTAGTKL